MSSRLDDITEGKSYGYVGKPGFNSSSFNSKEIDSLNALLKFKIFSQVKGEKLILKNNEGLKYYIIEDGTIFKYNEGTFSFYRLNLNDYIWEYDQTLASIYYDSYLKYQGLPYFEDYYLNREDLDLSNGMQR